MKRFGAISLFVYVALPVGSLSYAGEQDTALATQVVWATVAGSSSILKVATIGGVQGKAGKHRSPFNVLLASSARLSNRTLRARTHHFPRDVLSTEQLRQLYSSEAEGATTTTVPPVSPHSMYYTGVKLSVDNYWQVEDVLKRQLSESSRLASTEALQAKMLLAALLNRTAAGEPSADEREGNAGEESASMATLALDFEKGLNHSIIPILNNRVAPGSNMVLVQLTLNAHFDVELLFIPDGCSSEPSGESADDATLRLAEAANRAGVGLGHSETAASERQAAFATTLCSRLGLCSATHPPTQLEVAQNALANLVGSMTYFHGQQIVASPDSDKPKLAPPHGLYTGVPSRSFFPRGFLWDEGFHQLIVTQWDATLARRAVVSWLNTSDTTGWIAREQILGQEARERVPEQFRLQRPDIANPPTLLFPTLALLVDGVCGGGGAATSQLAGSVRKDGGVVLDVGADGLVVPAPHKAGSSDSSLDAFCARHVGKASLDCKYACRSSTASSLASIGPSLNHTEAKEFAAFSYPILKRHYEWFVRTQAGGRPGTFRWRGATPNHNFASGLDDYPRGVTPADSDENVDLLAWMATMAEVLGEVAILAAPRDVEAWRRDAALYDDTLEDYWDEASGVYCDYGQLWAGPAPQHGKPRPTVRGKVCHVGYVTIMPLLLRRIQASNTPRLSRLLAVMEDPTQLGSEYGLRSLSAADPMAGTSEDYWRQAVWVNINYLAVSALQHYGSTSPDAAMRARCTALASRISSNVVGNIVQQYSTTGFLWENYDSSDGHGRGTHPFTGWTALVTLLVADSRPL